MAQTPNEITALIGREVYSNNGVYVGEIEDIQLDLDDERVLSLAVTDVNPELSVGLTRGSRGLLLPYRWIRTVGDVVLVNDIVERLGEPDEEKVLA